MNPDIQPHELAAMRQAADRAPFDTQQKFHALLDAYEDQESAAKWKENATEVKKKAADAVRQLRAVYSDVPEKFRQAERQKQFGEPLSEDAWRERLEDCQTPEELLKTVADELERARAAEVKLRARIEALEDAIESALGELE